MNKVIGYKAFSCMNDRFNNIYKLNNEYKVEGEIKFGQNGFHFCEHLEDVFRYYDGFDEDTVICQVEGYGQIDTHEDKNYGYYDMHATSKMKILKVLSREEIMDIIMGKNIECVKRFIAGYKLTKEEKEQIQDKYNFEIIEQYIDYYQYDNKEAFQRTRGKL